MTQFFEILLNTPPKNFTFDYKASQGCFCGQQVIKTPIAWTAFLMVWAIRSFLAQFFSPYRKQTTSQQNETYIKLILYIIAVAKVTRICFTFSSNKFNNLNIIFDQKYNQIEASCMKQQKYNEEHAPLREKSLPVATEVAAQQTYITKRSNTQVTKNNSTIVARDKDMRDKRVHIQNTLEASRIFRFHRKLCSLRLLTTLISYQYSNGLLNLEHICFS